jgi:hypothetical protein
MSTNLRFLSIFLLFLAVTTNAQVRINEYSASNLNQFEDDYGKHEDWIEIYNAGSSAVDVSGWWLSDDDEEVKKWAIPAGAILEAGSHLLVWCDGRDSHGNGHYHAGFKLTQTKGSETLVLAQPNGNITDLVEPVRTHLGHSVCRHTDGGAAWYICTEPTPGASNDLSLQFAAYADRPDMDLPAGFYAGNQTISMTTDEPGGVIRITLDGTEPTETSQEYAGPITITQTTVVKAKVFSPNPAVLPGLTRFNTYFINEDFTLAVVSVGADSILELANGIKEIRPIGSIEYFDKNKVRKATSFGELNSHGQDSWVNDQRSLDWVSRDEMGYSNAIREKLFTYSDRDEYQRVILRASGDDNYPGNFLPEHNGCAHIRDEYAQSLALLGNLKLDVRAAERIIVFLNGNYWGVYGLREYPDDHDYTGEYYNQDKYELQILETWGDTWAQYGGDQAHEDWQALRSFVLDNDMADPVNYAQVKEQLDVTSMCDYFICGLNYVASDWINYNTAWWRGLNPQGGHQKWGYQLWDFDATFDYYINYSGVPDTSPDAKPCDLEVISDYVQNDFFGGAMNDTCITQIWGQDTFTYCMRVDGKHQMMLLKLIEESPEFRQHYYARQADLMNTVFSCDNMLHVLDSMVAVIEPEMTRHAGRWGGSYQHWQLNVAKLRNFISQRCQKLDSGMLTCYEELTGPHQVTLLSDPPGAASEITFNTLDHAVLPWSGAYFGGMENLLEVKPALNTGLKFTGWTSSAGSALSQPDSLFTTLSLVANDTIVAHFESPNETVEPFAGGSVRVYPTVFRDAAYLEFELEESLPLSITLVTSTGQVAATLVSPASPTAQGKHLLRLQSDALNLAPGLYFVHLEAAGAQQNLKVVSVGE